MGFWSKRPGSRTGKTRTWTVTPGSVSQGDIFRQMPATQDDVTVMHNAWRHLDKAQIHGQRLKLHEQ